MQEYLVISLLDESEEKAKSLLQILRSFFEKRGYRIVLVADGKMIDNIVFNSGSVLPFTAFVSGLDSLKESMEKQESLIFFDTLGSPTFEKTVEIMSNSDLTAVLTVGDDRKGMAGWIGKDSKNVIRSLSIAETGERLFIYPPSLGVTRENVIDTLIQIDSMTASGYFDRNKPFALIKTEGDGIKYDEIQVIADHIGMFIELVSPEPLPALRDYDAILAFKNPGYSISLTFRFGLPFAYMNTPSSLLAPAVYRALDAFKNFGG